MEYKGFWFGGALFLVTVEHYAGYYRLAEFAGYEEETDGRVEYAPTWARELDCPWEIAQ